MIDIHAHLNDPAFDGDRTWVLNRAREGGIQGIIDVSEDPASAVRSLDLFRDEPGVWTAAGYHPHRARMLSSEEQDQFRSLLKNQRIVSVGEIGLDYYYEHAPRNVQIELFEMMLNIALDAQLPVQVHSRESEQDMLRMLTAAASRGVKGLVHCFTGSQSCAERLLEAGFAISFSGIITFKNAQALREIVRWIPLDRLFVETDSPYLAPVPMRGKRNEPAFAVHTAAMVAQIRHMDKGELQRALAGNVRRLFPRMKNENKIRSSPRLLS